MGLVSNNGVTFRQWGYCQAMGLLSGNGVTVRQWGFCQTTWLLSDNMVNSHAVRLLSYNKVIVIQSYWCTGRMLGKDRREYKSLKGADMSVFT